MVRMVIIGEEAGKVMKIPGFEPAPALRSSLRGAGQMRNRAAHAYGTLDIELVCRTIEQNLPELKRLLNSI